MDAATTGLQLLFAASQVASADKQFSTDNNSVVSPSRPTISTDVLPSSKSLSIVTDGSDTEETTTTTTSAAEEADAEDNDDNISTDTDSAKTILSPKKKKEMLTFPRVLHQILSMTEYQAIVHWLDDGRSFIIEDKRRFALEILPKYFESSLFHSFTRKLNRWGFNRANSRSNFQELMFESKFFIRDDPKLCLRMKCKSREGRGTKKALDAMKKAQEEGAAQNNATPPPPPFSTFLCRSTQEDEQHNMEMLIRKNQEMINREHQKKLLKERQLIHEQMRYRRKLQIEMERLSEMYSRNEESLTRRIQALESSMMMISGDNKWRMGCY